VNKETITAHVVIRNEDVWIWYVIQSVLPYFDKIIIFDTGSEDHTLEILDTIKSDKITLIKKPKLMGAEFQAKFNEYRNEQIDMTTTDWWFLLDGDEIFCSSAINEMIEKLPTIDKTWTTLSVRMKYFVEHMHRVATTEAVESYKFVRTGAHRWGHGYGQIILADPAPARHQRLAHWYQKSGWDFECFHVTFLQRSSSCDGEDKTYQREHRKTRSVHGEHYRGKYGYSGPYPEVFYRDDVPEIVKKVNPYIEQIYKTKEEFGM
jgi:glycosyltransferase involved in cell wall biosynthesis